MVPPHFFHDHHFGASDHGLRLPIKLFSLPLIINLDFQRVKTPEEE
jgi:hypothetical protein